MSSYSVNGVPLTNPGLQWLERRDMQPYAGEERVLTRVRAPGRDGAVSPATFGSPTVLTFIVNTPPQNLEQLNALFAAQTLQITRADKPGISAVGLLASSATDKIFARNQWVDRSYLVEIPAGVWRDNAPLTSPAVAVAASFTVSDLLPGLSAPVQDAIIRVSGAFTGLQVTDSSGAWFVYPGTVPAGSYLRFHAESGRAWITTTDTWSGGTEVSGVIDYGGPRDCFEIAPYFGTNPSDRDGRLTVTTSAASGATMQVRGKRSYRL